MTRTTITPRPTLAAMLVLGVAFASGGVTADEAAAPATVPERAGASSTTRSGVYDPWESFNRAVFGFNLGVDRAVLRPVVYAYRDGVPTPVRVSIGNFFDNLRNPLNLVNNLLQAKPVRAGNDFARLVVNTTLGIGGLLDPAAKIGLTQSDEDFGQTLGKWGWGQGPYVVLPFLPPGGLRDQLGRFPDQRLDPFSHADDDAVEYGGKLLDIAEQRYRVIALDETLDQAYDPYAFVRDALAQRRAFQVRDGVVEPVDYDDLYEDPMERFDDEAPAEAPIEAPPDARPSDTPPR